MHPLMNRFHDDEQRRLMALLGVKESIAPLVSRRVFLQSAGATGLVIGFGWLASPDANAALQGAEGAATGPLAPNAFIRVGTDNLVTVICKHHEMGQGNTTGLATLVADELDADWTLVRTEYAPSDAEGVAVVATGMWAALQGRRALKVQWDESASKDLDSETLLARYRAQAAQPGTPFTKPTTTSALPVPAKTIEAVYEFPFLAHATMEPMNCVCMTECSRRGQDTSSRRSTTCWPRRRLDCRWTRSSCTRSCRAAALAGAPMYRATLPSPP